MDQLSKQQACQLMIEQEIEAGLAEGKTTYSIGKEISAWIAKLFDAHVKPDTIRVRADRMGKKLCTNVHNPDPEDPEADDPEWQEPPIITNHKNHKPKLKGGKFFPKKEELISEDFKAAWNGMVAEIQNARSQKWKTTSKEAASRYISYLTDIINV